MTVLSLVHWALIACLEAALLVLALRRKLRQRLPFFVAYLAVLVLGELGAFSIYQIVGFKSKTSFYAFWILQGIFVLLRAAVVYEICRSILSPLEGVWRLAKPLLLMMGCILLGAMLISTRGTPLSPVKIIPLGQRGLELIIVGLLIGGLAFCRYYRVQVENYVAWIALGLGIHSIIQATDNTLLPWLNHFALWAALSHVSFDIALIMWGVALWKPLPAPRPAPILLTSSEYQSLTPQVTARLRSLNTRLLEMWK
ncbi:MAG TPA: hypothetical protein VKS20_09165 [Candidatus Acidoferrales bacterium]|nr:hypothetical protein [Candidatus Acidoferrales bacterium]